MRSGERTYTRSEFGSADPTSLDAGCDGYLVKPIDTREFSSRLTAVTEGRVARGQHAKIQTL
jgi:DNA-binding response OmpR family regulator